MQGRCDKHLFEAAEDRCGKCGYEFCGECLVYSFGAKKPPFCIPCAVAAAGIRSNAGIRPMADARELKALRKERRSAARKQRRSGTPEPMLEPMPALDSMPAIVPSPVLPASY
ncbi:MAG: hypothetical protein QOI95_3441 [Acidimicrobiaceae bacterium]|jgi:hypothetical protein